MKYILCDVAREIRVETRTGSIREGSWLRAVTASPREKLVSDGSHDHLTNSLLSSSLDCNVYSVLQVSTPRLNRPYRRYRVKIRPRSVAGARIDYKTSMRCGLGWPRGWLREAQVGDERLRSEPKSQRLREHRTEPLGAKRSLRSIARNAMRAIRTARLPKVHNRPHVASCVFETRLFDISVLLFGVRAGAL